MSSASMMPKVSEDELNRLVQFCREFVFEFERKIKKHRATLMHEEGTSTIGNAVVVAGGVAGNLVSFIYNNILCTSYNVYYDYNVSTRILLQFRKSFQKMFHFYYIWEFIKLKFEYKEFKVFFK